MSRSIESVHQFTHDPKYRLTKEKTVVRCEDGAVYEFEQADDSPKPRLVRGFQTDGSMTHTATKGRLPAAVKETASVLLEGWSK